MTSKMQTEGQHRSLQEITPFKDLVTEAEYAAMRGVSRRTCQRDRQFRRAPPHIVIGRAVYYRREAIDEWIQGQERRFSQRRYSERTKARP